MSISELSEPAAPLAPPPLLSHAADRPPLACAGTLEVRLAERPEDLLACQRLRYHVFFEEMDAIPSAAVARERRDFDRYDNYCDHLLVIDRRAAPMLVGTYRLLRRAVAEAHDGYYTAGEYDLSPFTQGAHAGLNHLELGRSCVHAGYRTKPVIDLLWKGIGAYVAAHGIDVMFGCASFAGRDPDAHALALTQLARAHLAPEDWRARALPDRYEPMDRFLGIPIDERRAFRALPPVIRGYIRAGAYVGDGAVIDLAFGTVDVLIVFPVAQVADRYMERFGAQGA